MPGPPPSTTSPRLVMSGVSEARIRSIWMAISGCSTCAAVTAPRRLNSSCVEEDDMHGRPRHRRHQLPRDLQHHRAARPVIDRGAGNAPVRQFHHIRLVDNRRSHIDPGLQHRFGARKAGVDIDVLIGHDLVFFVLPRRVVRLVGDDAGDVAALADREDHRLRGKRPLRHAAQPLDPDQAVLLDLAHDQAELVHMGEQHHRGRTFPARDRRDQVAHPVGASS